MWAASNMIVRRASRKAPGYDPFAFIAWSSAAPVQPFLPLAVLDRGLVRVGHDHRHRLGEAVGAVPGGAGDAGGLHVLWTRLLTRHTQRPRSRRSRCWCRWWACGRRPWRHEQLQPFAVAGRGWCVGRSGSSISRRALAAQPLIFPSNRVTASSQPRRNYSSQPGPTSADRTTACAEALGRLLA